MNKIKLEKKCYLRKIQVILRRPMITKKSNLIIKLIIFI